MGGKETEACGRCAMSSATSLMEDAEDPFEGERIEVDEREMRLLSPAAWLAGVKRRADEWMTRLTYGRSR
jgi:hypothetical protein